LLDDAKHKAIAVAEREFCWEQQAPVFVKNIETALAAG